MSCQKSQLFSITSPLLILAAALSTVPVAAETIIFRVAFENVPGVAEIESGDLDAGIKRLESQLEQSEGTAAGDIMATLCAAYIMDRSLMKARQVCEGAVEASPTQTAFNNRGVYRIYSGDYLGAREDFARVRPDDIEAYLQSLRTTDVPLVAEDNFNLIDRILAERFPAELGEYKASRGARIQGFSD